MDEEVIIELLVADDNETVRTQIKDFLGLDKGLRVVGEAKDGQALIELAEEHRPDLVLMDLRMPKMDGFAAARKLKEKHKDLRIIFLSMHDNDEYRAEAKKLGAEAYLVKGVPMREVISAIKKTSRKTV